MVTSLFLYIYAKSPPFEDSLTM